MKILITGDRRWNDIDTIKSELSKYDINNDSIIVHTKQGASLIGYVAAQQLGFSCEQVESNELGDLVLAFHNYIRGSKQTMDIILKCNELKIPYKIIEFTRSKE